MTAVPAMAHDWPELGSVNVRDGTVPVTTVGGGPPLLLLHGWTLDHRMWRPQIETVSTRYRLIMPDRRGFGRATAAPDLAREADDVVRIADFLGLDRFALAGLSQGAGVALDVAVRFPDRLHAVALAGTPLPGLIPDPDHLPRDEFATMVRQGSLAMLRRAWLAHPLMHVRTEAGATLLAEIVRDYDGRDLIAPSVLPPVTREAIASLPMPLLALAGSTESPWRIACARLLADEARMGRFVSLPGAGHIANIDQPDRFNSILCDFLDAHCSPSS